MGRIPEETIEAIRNRTDIVDLVGRYVSLRQMGRSFKGLCPFHQEKTPSFHVHPERQIFHCFGCGEGGNAFVFLMKHENLSFPEAARSLASLCGIEIPETESEPGEAGLLRKLREATAAAQSHYRTELVGSAGANARAYLEKRGIDLATAQRFGLGYAPDSWDALSTRARRGPHRRRARPARRRARRAQERRSLRFPARTRDVPDPGRARRRDRVRRSRALRGPGTQVPQHFRESALPQARSVLRAARSARSDPAQRARDHRRGLFRPHRPRTRGHARVARHLRHRPHARTRPSAAAPHPRSRAALRRRRRRPARHRAQSRDPAARGVPRARSGAAACRRSRQPARARGRRSAARGGRRRPARRRSGDPPRLGARPCDALGEVGRGRGGGAAARARRRRGRARRTRAPARARRRRAARGREGAPCATRTRAAGAPPTCTTMRRLPPNGPIEAVEPSGPEAALAARRRARVDPASGARPQRRSARDHRAAAGVALATPARGADRDGRRRRRRGRRRARRATRRRGCGAAARRLRSRIASRSRRRSPKRRCATSSDRSANARAGEQGREIRQRIASGDASLQDFAPLHEQRRVEEGVSPPLAEPHSR